MWVMTAGAIPAYRTVSGWCPAPSTTAAVTRSPVRWTSIPSAHGASVPGRWAVPMITDWFICLLEFDACGCVAGAACGSDARKGTRPGSHNGAGSRKGWRNPRVSRAPCVTGRVGAFGAWRTCRVRGFRYATTVVELTVHMLGGGRLRAAGLGGTPSRAERKAVTCGDH